MQIIDIFKFFLPLLPIFLERGSKILETKMLKTHFKKVLIRKKKDLGLKRMF